jgi:NitT/TauT family transport system ATP-binding protein
VNAATARTEPSQRGDVSLRGIALSYGESPAIKDVSLDVPAGQFVSIVGPTGCGKTSVLNIVAGLVPPTAGEVLSGGKHVSGINGDCAYLFQAASLVPWKTALRNIMLGPLLRGRPRAEVEAEAREWLKRVGLDGLGDRYSHQLSGGQQKRVALAQALINRPKILLMDESFSALDAQTRAIMEQGLLNLWEDLGATVLFVTHDLEEAITLADRVILFSAGPGSVIRADVEVALPRPRDVAETKFVPGFSELYDRLWSDLRDEVNYAYGQTASR